MGDEFPEVSIKDKAPRLREGEGKKLLVLGVLFLSLALLLVVSVRWLAFENFDKPQILAQLFSGRPDNRLSHAREWLRLLQASPKDGKLKPNSSDLVKMQRALQEKDLPVDYRATLLAIMGYASDSQRASEILKEFLSSRIERDSKEYIFALLSMARVDGLNNLDEADWLYFIKQDDPALRVTVAYVLGDVSMYGEEYLPQLLQDGHRDVRWNAAIALAKRQNAKALPVLNEMFDMVERRDLPLTEESLKWAENLFRAVAISRLPQVSDRLSYNARHHKELRVRRMALENLPKD